jgi:hypothetical protein
MRTTRWLVATIAALPLLAGCGVPIQSGAHLDPTWDAGRRATFAWRDTADRTLGDARLDGNRFFHERLHEAVEWELSLRGIQYSETNPDILIHHHLTLSDHMWEQEVTDEAGVTRTETEIYEGGNVVIHLVDARSADDVWVGWARANIEPALVSPAAMESWVYDLVAAMFKQWPEASRTGS